MGSTEPIFLVGVPRSGTTMLAEMLSRHPSITCGPETHYFEYLAKVPRDISADRHWPRQALALLDSIRLNGQGLLDLYGMTIGEVSERLAFVHVGEAAPLEVVLDTLTDRQGKL